MSCTTQGEMSMPIKTQLYTCTSIRHMFSLFHVNFTNVFSQVLFICVILKVNLTWPTLPDDHCVLTDILF